LRIGYVYSELLTAHFFSVVGIYAGVAASLAERKKGGQLTEFLKNIRGTIEDDEWDQVMCTMFFFFCSLQLCLQAMNLRNNNIFFLHLIIFWKGILEV
jgi:hypothetical protein